MQAHVAGDNLHVVKDLKDLIETVTPSVAEILVRTQTGWEKNGTGFAISARGLVATCHHVIDGYDEYSVTFRGRSPYTAKLKDARPHCDLAILEIEAKTAPLKLGILKQVEVGREVIWCGFPVQNWLLSFHKGMISYVGQIPIPSVSRPTGLQLDGTMNRGNSGGPIIDPQNGQVVGILTSSLGGLHESLLKQFEDAEASKDVWGSLIKGELFYPVRMLIEVVQDMERLIQLGVAYGISVDYLTALRQEI